MCVEFPHRATAGLTYSLGVKWFACVLVLAIACGDDDDVDNVDASRDNTDAAPRIDAPPGAQWRGLRSLPNGPRQETAVVAVGGEVYLIGGFNDTAGVVPDVWVYDIADDSWSAGPELPGPVHHVNAAVVGGKIYLLGGLTGLSFDPTGFVLEHTPGGADWLEKTGMPAGAERGSSAVGVIGDLIYIAGGSAGGSVDTALLYDTVADSWDTIADLPEPLDHLVGAAVGDEFFAIGGRSDGITAVRSKVYRYDAVGDGWVERADMPTARGGTAAGVVNGVIVVVGGEGNPAVTSGVFPQTEAYDPVSNTWTSYDDMRTPRHGTGAVGVGNRLYVPGGADVQAFGAVDTNEVFVLP